MLMSKSLSNTPISEPRPGSGVNWDRQRWDVLNCGQTHVVLRRTDDNSITQLPAAAFYVLMKEGQITATSSHPNDDNAEIMDRLSRASEEDLRQANYRYEIVRRLLDGTTSTLPIPVSSRTGRRWRAMYKKAKALYGSGYLGLLPQTRRRGNSVAKLPEASRGLMATVIHQDYETHKQKSITPRGARSKVRARTRA